MLAGFTSGGDPIVHDPARRSGYGHVFDKEDLSHSWFDKGGIAYTFYPADSQATVIEHYVETARQPEDFKLYQNYPNPFNSATQIRFKLTESSWITIAVHNARGRLVSELYDAFTPAGFHQLSWNAAEFASGTYFVRLTTENSHKVIKMMLVR